MVDFSGKTAVVTGAASGIGKGLAERFAREGMRLLLADIEAAPLEALAETLRRRGADVETLVTDVSDGEAVEKLADLAYRRFGAVHVLCSNAGIVPAGRFRQVWEYAVEDWEWAFGVNVMGIVHGIRAFVPRMRKGGEWGHIVITASVAGMVSGSSAPVYGASKHAALRITEALYASLKEENSPIGVTALCPGVVLTTLSDSERRRPARLVPAAGIADDTDEVKAAVEAVKRDGLMPEAVAEMVVGAIRDNQFYLVTTTAFDHATKTRTDDLIARRNPQFVDTLTLSKEDNDARK